MMRKPCEYMLLNGHLENAFLNVMNRCTDILPLQSSEAVLAVLVFSQIFVPVAPELT